jgi:hypothetical protein
MEILEHKLSQNALFDQFLVTSCLRDAIFIWDRQLRRLKAHSPWFFIRRRFFALRHGRQPRNSPPPVMWLTEGKGGHWLESSRARAFPGWFYR